MIKTKKYYKQIFFIILILLVAILWSLISGNYEISFNSLSTEELNVLINIRIPRIIMVCVSGAALAVSGLLFQNVLKNPLASPDVLGISTGASVGAALAIVGGLSLIWQQFLAFVFAGITIFLVLQLVKIIKEETRFALIISGIVVTAIASSCLMLIKYCADPMQELPAIDFFLMGGFSSASFEKVLFLIPIVVTIIVLIYIFSWKLTMLNLPAIDSHSLGLKTTFWRNISLIMATILTAAVVAVAGIVSWIGLITPHIVRLLGNKNFTQELTLNILLGALILLVSDTLARTIATVEIPISIITSLLGAIILICIFIKNRRTTYVKD